MHQYQNCGPILRTKCITLSIGLKENIALDLSYTFSHIVQENALLSGKKITQLAKILRDRWSWQSRQISTL